MSLPDDPADGADEPHVLERLSLESLAGMVEMPVELIQVFLEHGLIEPSSVETDSQVWFTASCVTRLHTIRRLRSDLGINLPGIAVALDLLDRLQALQQELAAVRMHY